ncbi:polyserase-2-like [Toxorhynchites rutilus septentrionalis]|uniref:polyserase-2-like n=1 Tax=Toxorhynchites rutilus septentrionalis TaxID=329112 RepID=UPI002478D39C|nr:polyserase-2-like [Toxorhynchites rutilus septentrionalis]
MADITLIFAVLSILADAASADTCGQKKVIAQQYISHGYRAIAGAWPWHGAMFHRYQRSSSYACGVTVLTEQFVITAAHCTIDPVGEQRLPASRVYIKVGLTNLETAGKYSQDHDVDKIIRHDDYDQSNFENDIALMKLYTEITYTNYVQPICMWQGDTALGKIVKQVGHIVGWGLDENFGLPKNLNEATVPIVSKQDCLDSDVNHYSRVYHEQKSFCAGYSNGTAAGPGDSGGGLFLRVGNNWVLRGIVSNGRSDPNTLKIDSTSYVVFTDAAHYISWIRKHVTITASVSIDTDPVDIPSPLASDSAEQANLLGIRGCGKDSYPVGTPEELKRLLNQYPWLAVIEFLNLNTRVLEDVCHAVLIHPRFLLTAAHCVQRKRLSTIRSVRLNDYRLDTINDIFEMDGRTIRTTSERISVHSISAHPEYDNPKFANNIALVRLEQATSMTPICLPARRATLPTDKTFNIIGWKKNSRVEKPMIRNVVQIADFNGCRKKYAETNIPLDTSGGQICSTYNHDDGENDCSHYMGAAPFQYSWNSPLEARYFLAAISSFGHANCKREDFSDVFTNVARYADWIYEKVKRNE